MSGQVATSSNTALYSFKTTAADPNGFTVQLAQWGIGLTSPALQVFNASGQPVGSTSSTDPSNQTLSLHVAGVTPNATYFVQVADGIKPGLGVGTYQLQVSFNSAAQGTTAVAMTLPLNATGKGQALNNTTIGQAAQLQPPAGSPPGTRYATLGTLSASAPQAFFQVAPPKLAKGQSSFMTVSVEALKVGGLDSWATVFDDKGNPVPALCLGHEGGTTVLQIPVNPSVSKYEVEVAASVPGGSNATGDYYLGIQYGSAGASTQSLASGVLTAPYPAPAPQAVAFTADQPRYYRFLLGATAATLDPRPRCAGDDPRRQRQRRRDRDDPGQRVGEPDRLPRAGDVHHRHHARQPRVRDLDPPVLDPHRRGPQ